MFASTHHVSRLSSMRQSWQRGTLSSCDVSHSDVGIYYLDYETIRVINQTFCGQGAGVRDEQGVRGIVDKPASSYFGEVQFPGLFSKAAALLEGFSTTQFFFDGNKRTSFLSATTFLACNGYDWYGPEVDDAEDYLLEVAANLHEVVEIAQWLEEFSELQV